MQMPFTPEASYWPFSQHKDPKDLTEKEKLEVLMLKDIYAIGVCILEMMIGRFDRLKFNINIDNIPTEWGNLPESSSLIKVLVECIQLDCITKRQGKLGEIRKLLVQDFKKHFNKNYKMEFPFVGKRADMLNKNACVSYFNGKVELATEQWLQAVNSNNMHYYSCFNLGMKRFRYGEVSQGMMRAELGDDVFIHPTKGTLAEAYTLIATGHRRSGLEMLQNFI